MASQGASTLAAAGGGGTPSQAAATAADGHGGKAKAPARARTKAADLDADAVRSKASGPSLLALRTCVRCWCSGLRAGALGWAVSVLLHIRFWRTASQSYSVADPMTLGAFSAAHVLWML
jgi:hypothetical protein